LLSLVTYIIPFTGEKINIEASKNPVKSMGCGVLQTPKIISIKGELYDKDYTIMYTAIVYDWL
jgi:hypothetical protein